MEHSLSILHGSLKARECANFQGNPDIIGVYFQSQFPQVRRTTYSRSHPNKLETNTLLSKLMNSLKLRLYLRLDIFQNLLQPVEGNCRGRYKHPEHFLVELCRLVPHSHQHSIGGSVSSTKQSLVLYQRQGKEQLCL